MASPSPNVTCHYAEQARRVVKTVEHLYSSQLSAAAGKWQELRWHFHVGRRLLPALLV